MMKSNFSPILLFVVFALVAGCAGSKKAAEAPHPLAGDWSYSIDTPQGVFTGILSFTEVDDVLGGMIGSDQQGGEIGIQNVAFEENQVTFEYDSGQYGMMDVKLMLEGDALNGDMNVRQFGASVPFTAVRKAAESD